MRRLKLPSLGKTGEEIYCECANDFTEKRHRVFLQRIYPSRVKIASKSYIANVPKNLALLDHPKIGKHGTELLKAVYKQKFEKQGKIGRKYYDAIILNGGDYCPICELPEVPDTLDHFLPQDKYPLLCVTPENLIPSCSKCNENKHTSSSIDYYSIPFHPYYESITDQWLECEIAFKKDATNDVTFYNGYKKTPSMQKKYDVQLKTYKLDKRYRLQAVIIINALRRSHKRILIDNEKDGLLNHLIYEKESEESNDINSLQSAIYRELINQFDNYVQWLMIDKIIAQI